MYVVDLQKCQPFRHGLKDVLESADFIKVFHDFCEDAAALVRMGVHASPVFDTQIAYRYIRESDEENTTDFMKNSAPLNSLL